MSHLGPISRRGPNVSFRLHVMSTTALALAFKQTQFDKLIKVATGRLSGRTSQFLNFAVGDTAVLGR